MKFRAEPNLFVRISNKYVKRATGKKGFYFDAKGEYETDNHRLIRLLKAKFKEEVTEEPQEPQEPQEEISFKDIEEPKEEVKVYKCKKCDFETDNKGELLAHYRHSHAKEGGKE